MSPPRKKQKSVSRDVEMGAMLPEEQSQENAKGGEQSLSGGKAEDESQERPRRDEYGHSTAEPADQQARSADYALSALTQPPQERKQPQQEMEDEGPGADSSPELEIVDTTQAKPNPGQTVTQAGGLAGPKTGSQRDGQETQRHRHDGKEPAFKLTGAPRLAQTQRPSQQPESVSGNSASVQKQQATGSVPSASSAAQSRTNRLYNRMAAGSEGRSLPNMREYISPYPPIALSQPTNAGVGERRQSEPPDSAQTQQAIAGVPLASSTAWSLKNGLYNSMAAGSGGLSLPNMREYTLPYKPMTLSQATNADVGERRQSEPAIQTSSDQDSEARTQAQTVSRLVNQLTVPPQQIGPQQRMPPPPPPAPLQQPSQQSPSRHQQQPQPSRGNQQPLQQPAPLMGAPANLFLTRIEYHVLGSTERYHNEFRELYLNWEAAEAALLQRIRNIPAFYYREVRLSRHEMDGTVTARSVRSHYNGPPYTIEAQVLRTVIIMPDGQILTGSAPGG